MFNFAFGGGNQGGAPFGFPGPGGPRGGGRYSACYRCYPVAMHGSGGADLEKGDKIVLPQSALGVLSRMEVQYPMLFKLTNSNMENQSTHCGVMEFSATEGTCYVPHWIMQNLLLAEGGLIRVDNVSLPKATYVKVRPQTTDFINLSNPKAVLETALRRFSCLTKHDQICVPHAGKNYFLDIRDLRPGNAASVIETDVNLDFERPVDYKEPEVVKPPPAPAAATAPLLGEGANAKRSAESSVSLDLAKLAEERAERMAKRGKPTVVPFSGTGRRVDDKKVKSNGKKSPPTKAFAAESPPPNALKRDLSKFRKSGKKMTGVFGSDGHRLND